jgi:excisionase family DNA binding protein
MTETRICTSFDDLPARPTIQQSAAAINASQKTIRRRIREGKLKAYRVGPRAIRVDRESLLQLASQEPMGAA